jgi:hypothetical protein
MTDALSISHKCTVASYHPRKPYIAQVHPPSRDAPPPTVPSPPPPPAPAPSDRDSNLDPYPLPGTILSVPMAPPQGSGGGAGVIQVVYTDDAATKLSDRVRRRCFNCCTTDTSTWRRSNLSPGKLVSTYCVSFLLYADDCFSALEQMRPFERTHSRPPPRSSCTSAARLRPRLSARARPRGYR